jgi:hypothetical protein
MKCIEINNSIEFQEKTWEIQNIFDNEINLILLDNIDHCPAIRFPEKKIICVNSDQKFRKNYTIGLTPVRYSDSERFQCNETSFFFGGDKNSLYIFSNLIIKASLRDSFYFINGKDMQIQPHDKSTNSETVKEITKIEELSCPEIKFIDVAHHSKLIFFNCLFLNETKGNYLIETCHDAVVEFINCDFIGSFLFKSIHDSVIVRH